MNVKACSNVKSDITCSTLVCNVSDVRLDKYIKKFFPNLKQSIIEKSLRKGFIKVNNKKVKSSYRISCGEIIVIKYISNVDLQLKKQELKQNTKLIKIVKDNILYEDEYIVAINKPAGIVVQGGETSVSDVLSYVKDGEILKIVHRIDRDTSGVLIFARNVISANYLMQKFKTREIGKTYLALVVGIPHQKSGIIDCPLIKKYIAGQEKVVVDESALYDAVTYFDVLKVLKYNISYLQLKPSTGRTHQLRVHLAHINCPILGDGKYGGKRAFVSGLINKMHLHAYSLTLRLPNNKLITITAPIPQHIHESIKLALA